MKRTILSLLSVTALTASSAWATVSIKATPSSQNAGAGGSVNVSFTLTVSGSQGDPANVTGFDLYLDVASVDSGYFALTLATATGPFTSSGPNDATPDVLNADTGANYVRNNHDQGFSGSSQTTPLTNLQLETLEISIAANTPAGTYNFATTTAATAGDFFTDVSSGQQTYAVTNPGTFSITVVPEPGMGVWVAAGAVGLVLALGRRAGAQRRS